mmetsp:Transcript_8824/g.38875  ORF Transcript_8824/g.38875 Transcript_8824/m.38875 type:complete len:425 (-) Transcript_8824:183-1457(-)
MILHPRVADSEREEAPDELTDIRPRGVVALGSTQRPRDKVHRAGIDDRVLRGTLTDGRRGPQRRGRGAARVHVVGVVLVHHLANHARHLLEASRSRRVNHRERVHEQTADHVQAQKHDALVVRLPLHHPRRHPDAPELHEKVRADTLRQPRQRGHRVRLAPQLVGTGEPGRRVLCAYAEHRHRALAGPVQVRGIVRAPVIGTAVLRGVGKAGIVTRSGREDRPRRRPLPRGRRRLEQPRRAARVVFALAGLGGSELELRRSVAGGVSLGSREHRRLSNVSALEPLEGELGVVDAHGVDGVLGVGVGVPEHDELRYDDNLGGEHGIDANRELGGYGHVHALLLVPHPRHLVLQRAEVLGELLDALLSSAELRSLAVDRLVAARAVLSLLELLDDRPQVRHLLLGEGERRDGVAHGGARLLEHHLR